MRSWGLYSAKESLFIRSLWRDQGRVSWPAKSSRGYEGLDGRDSIQRWKWKWWGFVFSHEPATSPCAEEDRSPSRSVWWSWWVVYAYLLFLEFLPSCFVFICTQKVEWIRMYFAFFNTIQHGQVVILASDIYHCRTNLSGGRMWCSLRRDEGIPSAI